MVTTDYKRLFLRGLKWDAEDASITLAAALKAAARAQLTPTKTGAILTATAGNNHSVTFTLPGAGQGATPAQIAALCEELLRLYDAATAALVASGVPSPTDAQLLTEMLHRLETVVRMGPSDFTGLRCAA